VTCFRTCKIELSFVLLQKFLRKTIIIQSLNTRSLKLQILGLLMDWNILAFHILCLNETKIKNIHIDPNNNIAVLKKNHFIYCYDQYGIMILYNKTMISSKSTTMTHSRVKLIFATFNKNIRQAIHIITIYKPPTLSIHQFINFYKPTCKKFQKNCPTIVIGDFNISMLTKMYESLALQNLMSQYNFKHFFFRTYYVISSTYKPYLD
jgi:exonuclease III